MTTPISDDDRDDLRREDQHRKRMERQRIAHPNPMDPAYIEDEEGEEEC